MRSIKYGGFIMDVGRKELYNQIEGGWWWSEIFGRDCRDYPHQGGILYKACTIDMSPHFQEFRRGIAWTPFFSYAMDFLRAQLQSRPAKPRKVEE